MNVNLFGDKATWSLLSRFGIAHPFFEVTISTVASTWAILGILFLLIFVFRSSLSHKESYLRFCVLTGIRMFMDMITQSLGHFSYRHFSFIASLFFFLLVCNTVGVLPFLSEPATDLNTTFALGLLGLFYRDFYAIKEHGITGYLKELCEPFFFMAPLHILGKFSSLISISFRLFGNILAGMLISHLWFGFAQQYFILNIINFLGIGLLINLFFGLAEGLIQAFVFAMLSLTYLSIALAHEEGSHKEDSTTENLEKVIE